MFALFSSPPCWYHISNISNVKLTNTILVRRFFLTIILKCWNKLRQTSDSNQTLPVETFQKFTKLTSLMLSHIRILYKTTASRSEIYFPTLLLNLVVRTRDTHSRYFYGLFLWRKWKGTARKVCLLKLIKLQTFYLRKISADLQVLSFEDLKVISLKRTKSEGVKKKKSQGSNKYFWRF